MASSTDGVDGGELLDLRRRTASPLASAAAKIVGLVVTPTTEEFGDQVGEVAGVEPLAGQVVEPDGDAGVGEGLESFAHVMVPSLGVDGLVAGRVS